MTQANTLSEVLEIMCETHEFSELPVRHNEDSLNLELGKSVTWCPSTPMDSPHTKSNLLIQAHLSDLELPISDYLTDTRQVLDQTVRVSQAMVDVCAESGWLNTAFHCIHLLQMCIQGRWCSESSISFLPGCHSDTSLSRLASNGIYDLPQLLNTSHSEIARILGPVTSQRELRQTLSIVKILPVIDVKHKIQKMALNDLGQTECTIGIHLNRLSDQPSPKEGIYAPKFPKHKDEGWWIIIGNETTGELLALKKLNNTRPKMHAQLTFTLETVDLQHQQLTLYFMSDCYIGLDQQYSINITN